MKNKPILLALLLFTQSTLSAQTGEAGKNYLHARAGKWSVIMNFIYVGSDDSSITSVITSFPHPGIGPDHTGRGLAVYARNVVVKIDNDHDLVKQYWRLTDQPEWLAVQYEYTRKR